MIDADDIQQATELTGTVYEALRAKCVEVNGSDPPGRAEIAVLENTTNAIVTALIIADAIRDIDPDHE